MPHEDWKEIDVIAALVTAWNSEGLWLWSLKSQMSMPPSMRPKLVSAVTVAGGKSDCSYEEAQAFEALAWKAATAAELKALKAVSTKDDDAACQTVNSPY